MLAQSAHTKIALTLVALLLCLCWGEYFRHNYESQQWIFNADGQLIENDFINVWSAGAMAREGNPAEAYDWDKQHRVQEALLGHTFDGFLGWHYPPIFLIVAEQLAAFPYLTAWAGWALLTLGLLFLAMYRIIGHPIAFLLVLAFPVVTYNLYLGQNGMLSAALVGGALYNMERRPVLSGVLIGLLAYKPQLGVCLPLILIFERHWPVFFSATAAVLALAAISLALYGIASWEAFIYWLPQTAEHILEAGESGFGKLQSALGWVRFLGGGSLSGCVAQLLAASIALYWALRLRRQPICFEMKAASIAIVILASTPYLYTYDMAILIVPLGFLVKKQLKRGFLPYEAVMMMGVVVLVMMFNVTGMPFGAFATLLTALMIEYRAKRELAQGQGS